MRSVARQKKHTSDVRTSSAIETDDSDTEDNIQAEDELSRSSSRTNAYDVSDEDDYVDAQSEAVQMIEHPVLVNHVFQKPSTAMDVDDSKYQNGG